ncbi:MAG TPA: hypothetical protein VLH35_00435 [Candidatus Acidoferrales bacterium]|nr:hypothetical protein [Candidatus Acidoferrales bacterium]
MAQPIYECPFCDAPAWRTRYTLWKHIHECLRKKRDYIPDLTPQPIGSKDKQVLTA